MSSKVSSGGSERSNSNLSPWPSKPCALSRRAGRRPLWLQSHLDVKIPAEFEQRLSPESENGDPLIRLKLAGTVVGFAFLREHFQRFQLEIRIIEVWLEYDSKRAKYGQILILLSGPQANLSKASHSLHRYNITVEILGYVKD